MTQFLISIMDITPLSDSLSGDKALYDKAFKLVPGYRQQKICNLKNDAAKCRCLAAGLLLNYTTRTFISGSVSGSITGSLADNTPTVKNIPFPVTVSAAVCTYAQEYDYATAYIANGKPYFKEHENLHFNLSHSGNFAVCIVAGMPCGIDIEGNRPFKPSVAKRFFSKTEYHWIYDTENVSVQAERFFRLWTLKEAYAKATGNGIAAEIHAASYVPDTDSDGLCFADSETGKHFQIKEAEYDGLRIAAVLSDSAF